MTLLDAHFAFPYLIHQAMPAYMHPEGHTACPEQLVRDKAEAQRAGQNLDVT